MSVEGGLSLPQAEIVALFLESLLFGAFAVLYFISIWILMYRRQFPGAYGRTRTNKWMLATATTMFVLAIAHLGIDLQRAIDAFIVHGDVRDGTQNFYSNLSNPTHVAKSVIYGAQTLIGDSFVTYRLYIVWDRKRAIVILPIALLIGFAVTVFGLWHEFSTQVQSSAIWSSDLKPWITSYFSLSLTTNVIVTTLLAGKIIWTNMRVKKYRVGYASLAYSGVVETIVHSAAIYTVVLVSLLATYLSDSNAQYICLDATQPLIGIVFTLIIIRVGLNDAAESSKGQVAFPVPGSGSQTRSGNNQFPMKPLAINVSVSTTQDHSNFDAYDQTNDVGIKKEPDLESGGDESTHTN